ncbi:hypothetical protein [Mycobacterium simiae]|uniref:hypothetical protein n=1 Tax=Mycobacterium simiae TaxID=1784 RepID=UPI00111C3477|nr:hypothetical protein [Mycobacterium simiae]
MMDAKAIRAEYKRRRTVAIKKLREAGLSEPEIQDELAKIREGLGISGESAERDDNLPAVIERRNDSAGRRERTRSKKAAFKPKPGYDEHGNSLDAEKVARYNEVLANHPEKQCVATNTKGERCRSYAIPGARVCRNHGGATRHVKEAARVRLEMASNRLVGKLVEIAFDDSRPAAVQLDAIKDSLNRAGLTKPAQVEVGPIKPFEMVFDSISSERSGSDSNHADSNQGSLDWPMYDRGTESIDPQHESPEFEPPAQREARTTEQPPTQHAAGRSPGDFDRLSADESRVRADRDRYHRPGHITGEDAYQAANAANREIGALRALPPGRFG